MSLLGPGLRPRKCYDPDMEEQSVPITTSVFRVAKYYFSIIRLISETEDESGKLNPIFEIHDEAFEGSKLSEEFGLSQRDLRNLFVDVSTIEPRYNKTVVSIENLNCIITPNAIFVHVNG